METQYIHRVQYYETDRMGITHHSNCIRWMEEARIGFLDKIGWGYDSLEALGILSPIVSAGGGLRRKDIGESTPGREEGNRGKPAPSLGSKQG